MELEHYPGMTEAAIEAMIDQAFARFDIRAVRVDPSRRRARRPREQIVLVAVTSAHRGQAFQACEFLMDYLKTQRSVLEEGGDRRRRPLGRRPRGRRRGAGPLGHRGGQRRPPRRRRRRASRAAMPWPQIAVISLGASVGAVLRWLSGVWLNDRWHGFPLGTLFVNCVGGLLVGIALAWFERTPDEMLRLLLRDRRCSAASPPFRRSRSSR